MSASNPTGVDPKLMEAWFRLMADAMRGVQSAQEAMGAFAQLPTDAAAMQRWMDLYMPGMAVPGTHAFDAWLEEWYRTVGMVPRSRYLEALARMDELERRLRQADETIRTLRDLVAGQDARQETAQEVMDVWNRMMEETLKAQSRWLESWTQEARKPDDE